MQAIEEIDEVGVLPEALDSRRLEPAGPVEEEILLGAGIRFQCLRPSGQVFPGDLEGFRRDRGSPAVDLRDVMGHLGAKDHPVDVVLLGDLPFVAPALHPPKIPLSVLREVRTDGGSPIERHLLDRRPQCRSEGRAARRAAQHRQFAVPIQPPTDLEAWPHTRSHVYGNIIPPGNCCRSTGNVYQTPVVPHEVACVHQGFEQFRVQADQPQADDIRQESVCLPWDEFHTDSKDMRGRSPGQ